MKRNAPTASLLLVFHLISGCTQWATQSAPPAQVVAERHPKTLRVQRPDSTTLVLSEPAVVGDSLIGREQGLLLAEVASFAVRQPDTAGSILLVSVAVIALVVKVLADPCRC